MTLKLARVIYGGWFFVLASGLAHAQLDSLAAVRSLTEAGQFEQALRELDTFLEAEPNHVEGKLYRGVILTRKGDIGAAIESFSSLSAEYPDLPEPYNNLAVLYAAQRRYDDARLALTRAVELQPGYDTAHENLGDLYTKLAAISYVKAHRLNPGNQDAETKSKQLLALLDAAPPVTGAEIEVLAVHPDLNTESARQTQTSTQTTASDVQAAMQTYCYRAGYFTEAAAVNDANAWFTEIGANALAEKTTHRQLIGHRVYVPALSSAEVADLAIAELREQGISDLQRISTPPLVNAISLGVYSTEQAAKRRVAQVSELGVETAVQPRYNEHDAWVLNVTQSGKAIEASQFKKTFAGQTLENVSCP